ncbi:MAG: TonB-dependent receptor plug domain-containing protein [Spirochaetales bacterium]|nr:TonB-dependent receptor plug domain-containing protein [Spirochaetales bacterium]
MTSHSPRLVSTVCAVVCFFAFLPLYGLDLTVTVIDKDLDIPMEGVMLSSPELSEPVYTDINGTVVLTLPDSLDRLVLLAQLIGYEPRKILIRDFHNPVLIELIMEGVLEGEELVIIDKAMGETDEEVGTSTVMGKETIQSASKMGIIEDVMTSVAMLPGVSFSGTFENSLSVRGGAPGELSVLQDGFVVKFPFHWGGGVSIFNPNIVESVKFSPGVFSPKYGDAGSGVLEVHTITPDRGFRYSAVAALGTAEGFVEAPLGNSGGVFGGFRFTNYDLSFQMTRDIMEEQGITFSRIPYIYDIYFKSFVRPVESLEWYVNGFAGNDGVGTEVTDEMLEKAGDNIATDFELSYFNTDWFLNSGVRYMPNEKVLLHVLGGYEYWLHTVEGKEREFGTGVYSDLFKEYLHPESDTFTVDFDTHFSEDSVTQGIQGRIDCDYAVNDSVIWQNGAGSFFDLTTSRIDGTYYFDDFSGEQIVYRKAEFSTKADKLSVLKTFGYSNLNWHSRDRKLNMDGGVRLDWGYSRDAHATTVSTVPFASPRINATYTPGGTNRILLHQTFSMGAGIFAHMPPFMAGTDEPAGKTYQLPMAKTCMAIAGWETALPADMRFRLEGYYKYIFDRSYMTGYVDETTGIQSMDIHHDGIGHAAGFDLLLDRKISRHIDGLLSYSFIWARYRNPAASQNGIGSEPGSGESTGDWYYPAFHRYHTVNLLVNIKPSNRITFTTKLAFATGTPKPVFGDWYMYPAEILNDDGSTTLAEMYTSEQIYSDSKRRTISLPLDLKLSFHNYGEDSKVQWEFYAAVQDILSPVIAKMQQKDSQHPDRYGGGSTADPGPGFSFIIPSFGLKLSY